MEVVGKIKVVSDVLQVSDKYKKRELVVVTDEQYPQSIMIEFGQDKCDLLNGLNVGDQVTVSINLVGREWVSPQGETKYFNSIKGWRVEKKATTAPDPIPAQPFTPAPVLAEVPDDLPF